MKLSAFLKRYDYSFPSELVAQHPVSPRDSARFLVANKKNNVILFDIFSNIKKYLPPRSVLVFNNTKVIPARVKLTKETGGGVEILYIKTVGKTIEVLANKKLLPNSSLFLGAKKVFVVKAKKGSVYTLTPLFAIKSLPAFLEKNGAVPLPPYIKTIPDKKIRKEYQAVFAKYDGSSAAPTASLHFTGKLIKSLEKAGQSICYVTLHVGLGTFASISQENLDKKKLHNERYAIDSVTRVFLNKAKKEGRPIVAVGTTVTRALESACLGGKLSAKKTSGATDLFIQEGYTFQFVDGLITNFHVPKSSLLALVCAFAGYKKTKLIYQKVVENKFRLFSFGDGMLVL